MQKEVYHIPALLPECIEALRIDPQGIYVDVTFGGGGHSQAILSALGERGRLFGFDQDLDAYQNRLLDNRFTFVRGNFGYLKNFMRYYGVTQIDGLMADLGVSFHHFDAVERGFSFRFDGVLDMRMNQASPLSAVEVINTYDEEALANLFYLYGELRSARRIASALVKARVKTPIKQVNQLLEVITPLIDKRQEKKELAQLFQALRMEVNHETDSLKRMLLQAQELLKPGGRLVILTYHSLEDRLVKNFLKSGNFEGEATQDIYGRVSLPFRLIGNKPIVASAEEVARNPRSRSAKLRVAERVNERG